MLELSVLNQKISYIAHIWYFLLFFLAKTRVLTRKSCQN